MSDQLGYRALKSLKNIICGFRVFREKKSKLYRSQGLGAACQLQPAPQSSLTLGSEGLLQHLGCREGLDGGWRTRLCLLLPSGHAGSPIEVSFRATFFALTRNSQIIDLCCRLIVLPTLSRRL